MSRGAVRALGERTAAAGIPLMTTWNGTAGAGRLVAMGMIVMVAGITTWPARWGEGVVPDAPRVTDHVLPEIAVTVTASWSIQATNGTAGGA